jgi:hypothetical protein
VRRAPLKLPRSLVRGLLIGNLERILKSNKAQNPGLTRKTHNLSSGKDQCHTVSIMLADSELFLPNQTGYREVMRCLCR